MTVPRAARCGWTRDENGAFDAECGGKFEFTEDGPIENGFNYCPYCGKRLRVWLTSKRKTAQETR